MNSQGVSPEIIASSKRLLEAKVKTDEPLNTDRIVELTGLERKELDKAMKKLKAEGVIVSLKIASDPNPPDFPVVLLAPTCESLRFLYQLI